ncbi:MAG: MBL fold metallo-hydrolase [Prolixibacteraceae bacterium]|nr:MBL fold metallo-hydrolase [Prolixibacteraceae bacterium]
MKTQIFSLRFGINTCYIIRGEGTIMIDGGPSKAIEKFKKYLVKYSIIPNEIKLVVLTHADFDHSGSAGAIREITGAKIVIHENDRATLEEGRLNWPPGVTTWGKISHFILEPLMKNISPTPTKADIVLKDSDYPLGEYGIDGKIIYTPGHTAGHVSVLMDNGDFFSGCMAHNIRLFTPGPGLPIYAEDIEQIKRNWKLIIDQGATMIYPGHGKPFTVEKIKKYL